LAAAAPVLSQQQPVTTKPDSVIVRQRITSIIQETMKRGEMTLPEGTAVIFRTYPNTNDIEEVMSYGDEAVAVLADFIKSDNAREYELAMRLLSHLGGERIVEPLSNLILSDPSARRREYALRALTQAPWERAEPIFRVAAESDQDANVRTVARELMTGYAPATKTP
jgi:hypothetical protein